MNNEKKFGFVKISDEVISICAANAASHTKGVYELCGNFIDNLSKNIRGQEAQNRGIKLTRDENSCEIDIFLISDFNVKIPQVAWDVQVKVKDEVENITGIKVEAVNIHVQGVHIEEDNKDD